MNARSLTTLIALSFTGLAGAQCVKTPTHAFNGLVRITYPSGSSALLQQACDAGAQQLKADIMANARAKGIPVKWVEIYGARNWGSTFHDLIYKTRPLGYSQAAYSKYNVLPASRMSGAELLVYANKSGKYIAMSSQREGSSSAKTTDVFVVYGN
ncbi:hypothetical protein [Deinococcus radiotolerans]|uniref:Uncharacterized protein n=1 Tax=Deinococcus radiotolerans TaxID=1309407 RepID=A0ABQ2FIK9_9DEIO|nr:hypothetical protein [Deinococcus radiotolerans]GGK92918.1 hypothetical protein GCM10010844_09270 [Deinococcus radiotolerans]